MTKNIKKSLVLMFIAGFFVATAHTSAFISVSDVELTHFEDGSGRVTYCLPMSYFN